MDGLVQLADWANANEGLLQALAMVAGAVVVVASIVGPRLTRLRRNRLAVGEPQSDPGSHHDEGEVGAAASIAETHAAGTRIRSIGVLPLQNLSGDSEQEYFADGVTEDLIGALSEISSLRIPSHRSVMRFKTSHEPLPAIAAELGVDALIEGSVRREGDRVRITVQLIHGSADEHLWHKRYDENLSGILSLQARIARSVAGRVQAMLPPDSPRPSAAEYSVVAEAYDAFLQARQLDRARSGWVAEETAKLLERAVALDPEFGRAHAWLGTAYIYLACFGFIPAREVMPKARAMATKAVELGDLGANGLLSAIACYFDWDFAKSREYVQRARGVGATALHASAAEANEWTLFCIEGDWESGLSRGRSLVFGDWDRVDPIRGRGHFAEFEARSRRYDAAIADANTLLSLDSELLHAYLALVQAHGWKGEFDEAFSAWTQLAGRLGVDTERALKTYRREGLRATVRRGLDFDLKRRERHYVSPVSLAERHAQLGDVESAFSWLDRGYEERDPVLVLVFNLFPSFDPIRDDPRFADLAQRVGIPLVEPDGPRAAPLPD